MSPQALRLSIFPFLVSTHIFSHFSLSTASHRRHDRAAGPETAGLVRSSNIGKLRFSRVECGGWRVDVWLTTNALKVVMGGRSGLCSVPALCVLPMDGSACAWRSHQ